MKDILNPEIVMTIILVMVVFAFLLRSFFTSSAENFEDEINEFLWASRGLTKQDVSYSTFATYSAFATVIFWFLTFGYDYGYWIFIIPIALLLGNFIFVKLVRSINIDFSQYRTIGDFIYQTTKVRQLGLICDFIVIIFLWAALLVEMVIGSGLIEALIGGVWGGQLTVLVVLSLVVLTYVLLGGYRAIVKTDRLQIFGTIFGSLAIFFLCNIIWQFR